MKETSRSDTAVRVCGYINIITGIMFFTGLILGIAPFLNVLPGYVPMNSVTALCFIALGSALVLLAAKKRHRNLIILISVFVISNSMLALLHYVSGVYITLDLIIPPVLQSSSKMAPNTAVLLLAGGIVVLFLKNPKPLIRNIVQYTLFGAGFVSLFAALGFLYKISSFYHVGNYTPMALNTSAMFLVFFGGVTLADKQSFFMQLVNGNSASAVISRRMIPLVLILPVILGWLRIFGENAGLYGYSTGVAIFVICVIAALFIMVIYNAARLKKQEDEKSKYENDIIESERKLRAVIDNSTSAIYLKDLNRRFIMVNKATQQNHGLSEKEFLGKTLTDLFPGHPDAVKVYEEHDRMVIESLNPHEFEETAVLPDGIHTYLSQKFPLTDVGGKVYAMCGISTDITERKRSEEQTITLNTLLQQSNNELESFSYSVSHDLRAPLRHIIGFGEKLKRISEDHLSDEELRLLGKINTSAAKMGRLIDDLLMFSRVGRTGLSFSRIELNDIIDEFISEYNHNPKDDDIIWNIEKLPAVNADPFQMKIVLDNLLSNAVKYTSRSEKRIIKVSGIANEKENVYTIKDSGCGFDMNYADKLFGVFQRLHRDDEYEGTGIGLATVRRIISRHNGTVWAHSTPGDGASFHFSLPR
ncbi:MAG TPA: ATP-binding protein [Ignavibacteria bacterium]|nr:ATP-binding protein [Ignavibacteria bacterium]HMQ98931.1 ATP-binding protein [Ignavibacteria bacterium]